MVLTRRPPQQDDTPNGTKSTNELQRTASASSSSKRQNGNRKPETPVWVWLLLVVFAAITVATIPEPFHPPHGSEPSLRHVFYYGWLTAISTGFGALPFLLFPDVATFWVGISNGTCLGCKTAVEAATFHLLVMKLTESNHLLRSTMLLDAQQLLLE